MVIEQFVNNWPVLLEFDGISSLRVYVLVASNEVLVLYYWQFRHQFFVVTFLLGIIDMLK